MEKITYFATIIDRNRVEIYLCDEIPDFAHAVKVDHLNQVEFIFDANSDWTPELENQAMSFALDAVLN